MRIRFEAMSGHEIATLRWRVVPRVGDEVHLDCGEAVMGYIVRRVRFEATLDASVLDVEPTARVELAPLPA